jgi:hypothetical protein
LFFFSVRSLSFSFSLWADRLGLGLGLGQFVLLRQNEGPCSFGWLYLGL